MPSLDDMWKQEGDFTSTKNIIAKTRVPPSKVYFLFLTNTWSIHNSKVSVTHMQELGVPIFCTKTYSYQKTFNVAYIWFLSDWVHWPQGKSWHPFYSLHSYSYMFTSILCNILLEKLWFPPDHPSAFAWLKSVCPAAVRLYTPVGKSQNPMR